MSEAYGVKGVPTQEDQQLDLNVWSEAVPVKENEWWNEPLETGNVTSVNTK